MGFRSQWQPQRCSVLLRPDNSLLHFCCVCAHTQLQILELALCAVSCEGRVQKEGLCKRAWQGVCAERETYDPEVPLPQPLKGQRFGSGSEKFSHSWLLVQLSRVYKTFGGGDWNRGLENRTRFEKPGFFSSLCRVFYFPLCLHLPTCKTEVFPFERQRTDDARYQVCLFSPSWKTDSCTDLFILSGFCHT